MLCLSREMGLSFCNFAKGHTANAFSRGKACAGVTDTDYEEFCSDRF